MHEYSQAASQRASGSPLRMVTYNLRYDSMPDDISVQNSLRNLPDPLEPFPFHGMSGEQPWSMRRIKVVQHLLGRDVVLAGFQEALVRQVHDLAELFGDSWSWIGVGRDDGGNKGEFNPIFYDRTCLDLISEDTFWLSNTPFTPSAIHWSLPRICTTARFTTNTRDGVKGRFAVLNTHLDHASDKQRRLGASLLLHRARFEAATSRDPVFLLGDFNSTVSGLESGAYKIITGAIPPVPIPDAFVRKFPIPADQEPNFKMLDLRGQMPRFRVSGNFATFTGFTSPDDTSNWIRIDFVFGGSNGGWIPDTYRVETALTDDGVLASDHRPTFVEVSIQDLQ